MIARLGLALGVTTEEDIEVSAAMVIDPSDLIRHTACKSQA